MKAADPATSQRSGDLPSDGDPGESGGVAPGEALRPRDGALVDAERMLRRVGDEAVRGRLHRTLVLWDLGYVREALSQFRVTAESALARLLELAEESSGRPASELQSQRERLDRGQASKVVEWLYNHAEVLPARLALHLHTLLGWGNYASHHQRRGHHARGEDLSVLLSVAIELEEWLAQQAGAASILDAEDSAWQARELERAAVDLGLATEVARRFVDSAGRGSRAEDDRLVAPHLGLELFFARPAPREQESSAADHPDKGPTPAGGAREGRAQAEASPTSRGRKRGTQKQEGPYRGLACFEPEDAAQFFGRDETIEALTAGVAERALSVVSGVSGVGKTSLLRAGLLPRLLEAGHGVLWLSDYPAAALRTAMQVIGAWPGDRLLVVIFDQAEHAMLPETPAALRRGLLELLLRAERWRYGIRMVVSLREDFLGRLLREADAVDREQAAALHEPQSFVGVGPLSAEATRQAMVRPLEGSGVRFDEALTETLAEELVDTAGTPPAQLQLICTRLYEQAKARDLENIDLALYREVGGAEKILESYLDEVLASARYEGQRPLARAVLKAMAGTATRRWVDLGGLWRATRVAGVDADAVHLAGLLQRLADDRLLATHAASLGGAVEYSLVHDQLAVPVREWRSATELERQQAQELLDRAVAHFAEPAQRELLGGRQLKLVERHWEALRRRDPAPELLAASRRSRLLRRGTSVALAALGLFGAVFGAVQLRRAVVQRDRALAAADQGVLLQARLALPRDPSLAVAWLRNLSSRASSVGVLTVLEEARRRGVARILAGHHAPVTAVAYSRDGNLLVTASHDRTLRRWDPQRAKPRGPPLRGHKASVACLALSGDGRILASGDLHNEIRLWDAQTGMALGAPLQGHDNWVYGLAFAPDGKTLASASLDGSIRLWRLHRRQAKAASSGKSVLALATSLLGVLRGHGAGVTAVVFAPNGKTLASASSDKTLRLWDVASRSPRGEPLRGHQRGVLALAFSPDGKTLASAGLDATVRFWDAARGRALGAPLRRHQDAVIALAFSPGGETLASAGEDKAVVLWDVARREPRGVPLRGHLEFIRALAFSPDGKTLASASQDHTVRLWDLAARKGASYRLEGHRQWVHAVAFSPGDGALIASAARDGTIRLWDRRRRRAMGRLVGHEDAVVALAFSPDGRLLASASHDRSVRLWRLGASQTATSQTATSQTATSQTATSQTATSQTATSQTAASQRAASRPASAPTSAATSELLFEDDEPLTSVAFSRDGKLLASGGVGEIRLWSLDGKPGSKAKALGAPLGGHDDTVSALAFSPDGHLLASAGFDGKLLLWNTAARQQSGVPLVKGGGRLHQIAFAPDGKLLAAAGADATLKLFDVATRRARGRPLSGHQYAVYGLAFAPSGETLASVGADATLRLWSVTSGRPLGSPLRGHGGTIYTVAYSPDGALLATGSADRSVWLWQTTHLDAATLRERIDALTNLKIE